MLVKVYVVFYFPAVIILRERTIAILFLLQSNFMKANIHPQIFLAFISETFPHFTLFGLWTFHEELILLFVSPVFEGLFHFVEIISLWENDFCHFCYSIEIEKEKLIELK